MYSNETSVLTYDLRIIDNSKISCDFNHSRMGKTKCKLIFYRRIEFWIVRKTYFVYTIFYTTTIAFKLQLSTTAQLCRCAQSPGTSTKNNIIYILFNWYTFQRNHFYTDGQGICYIVQCVRTFKFHGKRFKFLKSYYPSSDRMFVVLNLMYMDIL
jgi:hypothetical protein